MQRLPIAPLLGTTILGAGCAGEQRATYQGYVEGEYLYLAAPAACYLQALDRPRGSRVAAGEALFAIAPEPDADALAEAEARAESARQQLATYRATLGREAEVKAAEAEHSAADAAVVQRRWVVERMVAVAAPATGEISDTYYRPGEWVAAGSPVASLLPDARRWLRFYVPCGPRQIGKSTEGATVIPRATKLPMTVQFALESVSSLPWNHCPDSRGITVQVGLEFAP